VSYNNSFSQFLDRGFLKIFTYQYITLKHASCLKLFKRLFDILNLAKIVMGDENCGEGCGGGVVPQTVAGGQE
jgi:hypothetical protein